MKISFDSGKIKEIILNLEILKEKTTSRRESLTCDLIRAWYESWFKDPQSEELFKAWSASWNELLARSGYEFPVRQNSLSRPSYEKFKYFIVIDGKKFSPESVKLTVVTKAFEGATPILQNGQKFSSFMNIPNVRAELVIATINGKDSLVDSSEIGMMGEAA